MLYKTVAERMLVHGASAWGSELPPRSCRSLDSIQRRFLLLLSSAFKTTSTAALQILLGLPPLALVIKAEADLVNIYRLRVSSASNSDDLSSSNYETDTFGWLSHPSSFPLDSQIITTSTELSNFTSPIQIFTDGSKLQSGEVGAAMCVFKDENMVFQKQISLARQNSVFQAELKALLEAVSYANLQPFETTIFSDSLSGLFSIKDPFSKSHLARQIAKILSQNDSIRLVWIKGHSGVEGNELADALAKGAASLPASDVVPWPKSYLKSCLRQMLLSSWTRAWDEGDTGRLIHEIFPVPSLSSKNLPKEIIYLITEHGPFPAYFKRFTLRETDNCNCGLRGTSWHYLTECSLTTSFHMKTSSSANLILWKQNICNYKHSMNRAIAMIRFVLENERLIIPLK